MKSFKHREVYAQLKVAPPIMLRLDGVAFSRVLSRLGVQKPYDEAMREASVAVCHAFFTSGVFSPLVVYAFSDEFNVYLEHLPFDGRVEKLDSVAASLASSVFTSALYEFKPKEPLCFDARLIPLQRGEVVDYLIWRQAECWRNCMNSYAFYTLVGEGMSNEQAAAHLAGKGAEQLHELLFERGINLAKAPPWQRRGMLAYRLKESVGGYDPTRGEEVHAERARLKIEEAPLFSAPEGRRLVERALEVRD
ncbi:tRNA(His) guanylyltransferase Thg1 family protein [Methermicoccus shengliensis]|uniref:tRNA(His) guanylyltransferase n=1 Tax=Methermicoccus shengliensis TaxID=660064 RepID=A0A832RU66_9EURY|nr:tRNA(His) guanylyltransferase Thg1 family protein [Methermicoccus shengliensis]KUK04763.1 MAG: Uncharacterized protein XD46_0464 [Euryarchaeota archaeon 55_53]KUK29923.1 MAG: Uncharacterized protein XD62_0990 [Methanosarcinales archeaon 56_1174]MDI3487680.1 tRNA(His) guanylyltransferase [Methanosarcinales archaeon]MDN5295556.1 tRNA(His) guanylyltransferase [Methanosarcinales archaeon]HIH70315.1 tRNA 5'-guanylyltransferase [Methermicoccus shengliensis]